jgi:aryl-alcohol dehydrogenase-like predicted oxidoreductase
MQLICSCHWCAYPFAGDAIRGLRHTPPNAYRPPVAAQDMTYRPLGASGLLVSTVGLGCNNFGRRLDLEGTRAVVDAALDVGVTLFDTADTYGGGGSETLLGEVLRGRREQVVLATKFGHQSVDMGFGPAAGGKGSRGYVRRALHASLRRLQTDYVDLYQIHTPDPVTPVEETVAALQELVADGLVRYWGHSNFAGWQVAQADQAAREYGGARAVSAQNQWSLLERATEREVVPACAAYGVGVLPYFPLANGLLTGKVGLDGTVPENSRLHGRDSYVTADKLERLRALTDWARARGRSILEVAIGWLAAQPTVGSVIPGATTPDQVRANASVAAVPLTGVEAAEVSALVPAPA